MPSDPAAGRPDGVDQRLTDGLLATTQTLVVALVIAADLEGTGRATAGAYLFAVGFGALVLAGRRAPRPVLVLTVSGVFAYYSLDYPPIGIALPAVAALYRAADVAALRWAVGSGVVLVGVAAWARVYDGLPTTYLLSYELLTNVALVAAAIALGVSVRARRETRFSQERLRALTAAEQAREGERRLQAERVRIAQDLHDSVGHAMSVIALHGNVAAEAIGRDDETARRAVAQIAAATSAQLRELRATVKLLRSPAAGAERGTVGLSGLGRLTDNAREAGLAVDLDVDVPERCLDEAIEAAAYRIVQESLTNVLRHSRATHAAVTAGVRGDRLELVIADDGPSPCPEDAPRRGDDPRPGNGHRPDGGSCSDDEPAGGVGLAGMRERAAVLGGQVRAGRGDRGGFVVRAVLPTRLPP
ncbi:sensor histidine kinase [Geodermatophilus sabuli]|uniref:histidine kinase n=1 Tax=Geodermatophilus sabuli TaxID=1564158 RepID=A0A285E634_9ACTN|nr:sensor histidine kinase [Geodermatophilus sabuli]MBB3082649.1 signal transduction histidine kinase [Geodermatophilus sabuli]SNX94485.1 Signal transduction histidine kinase [Geodermatophilus sabuli]